jgi:hypothetical protein
MMEQSLTVALVRSILQVLGRVGPTGTRRRWRQPKRRGRRGNHARRLVLRAPMNLDWLHRTGGALGRDSHTKQRSRTLTLGLGFLHDHYLPPPHYRPIGRWNTQTRPSLREVTGKLLMPSSVWARPLTRLH